MRADSKPQPPHQAPPPIGLPAGRPRFYGAQGLMEAWLGVEECKARHNCSANRACKRLTLNFLTAGTPATNRDYAITKETLRSLYQRAVRLLKAERDERDQRAVRLLKAERDERADLIRSMRAIGASSPQEHAPLPLATYCQEQLKYRLQSS